MLKFNEAYLTDKELNYIQDVFEKRSFSGNGVYTRKCEALIKRLLSAPFVLLTDSCTSSLEMAALCLRERTQKQEVIVPSYTFSSTAAAFLKFGFDIVFCDIDPRTMMIDFDDAEAKVTSNTVALVGVHYGGSLFDFQRFLEFGRKHSICLVEDAAQAFGASAGGIMAGTVGDFGCFSFHETKNIHAGLAGALVVNNRKYTSRATHIRERGTNREDVLKGLVNKYSWVEIGGSYYPTELQSAFLLAQLESFSKNMKDRKEIFSVYLSEFEALQVEKIYWQIIPRSQKSNFHAFWVMFSSEEEADFVRVGLGALDIQAFIGYVPLHSSKVGLSLGNCLGDLPKTEEYSERILRLPLHNSMKPSDASLVVMTVEGLLNEYRRG